MLTVRGRTSAVLGMFAIAAERTDDVFSALRDNFTPGAAVVASAGGH